MGELGTIYEDARGRITELVRGLGGEAAATVVPACPEWSVHDLAAHLTGNCADIVAGNVDGAATAEWTARQVAERRDRSLTEIVDEWADVAPQVAPLLDDFPGRYGQMLIADVISHEHDIRGALRRPGARDSSGIPIALDFLASVFLHTGVNALGLPPIEVRAGEQRWVAGTGGPATGDLDSWRNELLPDGDAPTDGVTPAATLSAAPYELMRAIAGRRAPGQISRFEWSVDPERYLPAFGFGPFEARSTDLVD
jgi:uncharacterized protein (TIGR03083 family)